MDEFDTLSDISMSANGSEKVSSATSPTSSACATPQCSRHVLSRDAHAIVANLSNFAPLGCLCFEDFISDGDAEEVGSWREVAPLPLLTIKDAVSSNLALLQKNGWIRLQSSRSQLSSGWLIYRVYLLYSDVGLSCIKRDDSTSKLKNAVRMLLGEIDVSPTTWNGFYLPGKVERFEKWATRDEDDPSLFYAFNTLPSPAPVASAIDDKYAREALEDLLDSTYSVPGLKTTLYPYQRRSAGGMLQREATPRFELDPRLEERKSPNGSLYYYDCRKTNFQRDPQYFETCRGGILAETMGLGKTLVCLALILATKHHLPKIPPQYAIPPRRPQVGSLVDMAASAINLKSIPWKIELDRMKHHHGDELTAYFKRLWDTPALYDIPQVPLKWCRTTKEKPPQRMTLTSTTLIVVPPNLCKQWQSEIIKHIDEDSLKVLVMDDRKQPIPDSRELRSYDVILFSRNRFDMECRHGADEQGRRPTNLACRCPYIGSSRKRDCTCLRDDDLYTSPLKELHFKRIIVDEGHFFSHSSSNAASVAEKLITADHRWVVSGTPAKDLLGVEVDMSAIDNIRQTPDTKNSRHNLLQQRRYYSNLDRTGAIESLSSLAGKFLKVRPWSEQKAYWREYMFRHEDFSRLTYSGFSPCLRKTLKALVVKTQPDDVEKDIGLPPLNHQIIRLQPSFYDKLTANLFTLVLLANAVTSEREDKDYIFHKDSAKARQQLIYNLRQSAFFWTGFTHNDVLASVKNSTGYLAKEQTGASPEDRQLLNETLTCTEVILQSAGWASMSRSHELGIFVDNWPETSAEHWSFDGCIKPVMTGISQLLEAQKFLNTRLALIDPGDGLSGAGVKAMMPVHHVPKVEDSEIKQEAGKPSKGMSKQKQSSKLNLEKPILNKAGIPTSSLDGEPSIRRRASVSSSNHSPRKGKRKTIKDEPEIQPKPKRHRSSVADDDIRCKPSSSVSAQQPLAEEQLLLPQTSPYSHTKVVGTSSAKMSYLLSQILEHYKDEKILIFYQGDNIAYYIAQVLELFHIRHEIYAKSLSGHLKAEYVVRFDQESHDRVLIMDVSQAAFGLNLSSASRIYFVNPVCRPDVEAQAIKRAHRIGQTRPVYVETLVLQGSLEEKMLERSKRMTRAEHLDAKLLEDDGGIRQIIQDARLMTVSQEEMSGRGQMAPLELAQQLWARPGWSAGITREENLAANTLASGRKKETVLEDTTELDETERIVEDDTIHNPRVVVRRRCAEPNADREDRISNDSPSDEEPLLAKWSRRISLSGALPHMLTLPSMASRDDALTSLPAEASTCLVAPALTIRKGEPSSKPLKVSPLLND